ncbi:hypothetical protein DSO57_1018621 [Entomophthora muscae]|nr:hypothetical protein DSO57_1018621 [Entomophthora muscae]
MPQETNASGPSKKTPTTTFRVHSRDPWARRDAWRNDPIFSFRARMLGLCPGLGIATVAFAAYCVYDHYYPEEHH